jgi:ketosteroid isomerase-like protein
MLETMNPGNGEPEEALVRSYLAALNNGESIEALNAFATDALYRDESGREQRGIREIVAAFVRRQKPLSVEIEELQRDGDAVSVRMRMTYPAKDAPRVYRSVFRVQGDRIRSLVIDPLPVPRSRKSRVTKSA